MWPLPFEPRPAAPRRRRIVIAGPGFGARVVAVALRRAGHEDVVVLDGSEVAGAAWDERACAWGLAAVDGRTVVADVLVPACARPGRPGSADGAERESLLAPMRLRGRGGRELAALWSDHPRAHHGMVMAGFPNMFLLHGPNTDLGAGAVGGVLDAQAGYVVDALRRLDERGAAAMDVDPTAMAVSDARTQARLAARGRTTRRAPSRRDSSTRPGSLREYADTLRRVRPEEFEFLARAPERRVVGGEGPATGVASGDAGAAPAGVGR